MSNDQVATHKCSHCKDCVSRFKGIFCELSPSEMDSLSAQKVTNIFRKGQTLFVEGCPSYGLYCINKGNVKISKTSVNGRDTIIRVATGGDIIGHRSLFSCEPYSATATAIEDTSVCFIDKNYIMGLIRKNPSVTANILSKLGKALGESENRLASFSQKNVFERTSELLLLLSESHGDKLNDGSIELRIKLTREDLAAMVGTAPETLIRTVSELKSDGVIGQSGKTLIIKDENRLFDYANIQY